jgi:DNA-binding PadR family transcriptional regulator
MVSRDLMIRKSWREQGERKYQKLSDSEKEVAERSMEGVRQRRRRRRTGTAYSDSASQL